MPAGDRASCGCPAPQVWTAAIVLSELVTFKKVNPTETTEVDHTRRAGSEDTNPTHRSAGTIIASTEPIKKRAQLTHLSQYDADAKTSSADHNAAPHPLDAKGGAGAAGSARPVSRAGLDDKGGRPPLRAFDANDDVAESKSNSSDAEIMTFK